MTSGSYPQQLLPGPRRAVELWVLTSVFRNPFHAAYLIRSKKCLYLEPRYGIEP